MATSSWPCFSRKTHAHEDVGMAHGVKRYHCHTYRYLYRAAMVPYLVGLPCPALHHSPTKELRRVRWPDLCSAED